MKRQWENEELIENWMLSAWDLAQLGNKIGTTRLGFAALLSTEELNGWQEGQAGQQPQDLKDVQDSGTTILQQIRKDPGRVGLATMLEEMAKLRSIRELQLPDNLFPGVARKVLAIYRNRASIEEPSRLCAYSKAKRLTYLSALCLLRAQEITYGLVDLLIHIVHKIDVRAEKRVEQEYLNEFKRVANKEGILYRIAEAAVERPDETVREVSYPIANEKLLREVIKEYKARTPAFRKQVQAIMRASYSHHYRRMVPEMLDILDFRSNNERYCPVMIALQIVKNYVHSPRKYYPDHEIPPIKEVVATKWREFVVEQDDDGTVRVNRLNYEVCMFQALREKVRVREIWVESANRYLLGQQFDQVGCNTHIRQGCFISIPAVGQCEYRIDGGLLLYVLGRCHY